LAKQFLTSIKAKVLTGLDWPVLSKDAASKEYVDAQSGGGGNSMLPFWESTGTQACIPTNNGALPFWDSSGTPADIPLGC